MRALRFLSLLLLLVVGCTSHGVRRYTLDRTTPDDIVRTPVDVAAYAEEYPGDDGIFLYREYCLEQVERPHTGNHYSYDVYKMGAIRYLVLDPDAEWLGTFDLTVDEGEELRKVYITVIAPDGSIRQFDKGDLRETVDEEGRRRYRLAYPGIVKGSVVDEGYEIYYDPSDFSEYHHQIPLRFSIPTERLSVRYVYPSTWTVGFRGNHSDSVAWVGRFAIDTIEGEDAVEVASYEATDIPALVSEPYSPFLGEIQRNLEAVVRIVYFPDGSTLRPLPATWKSYASGYGHYAAGSKEIKPKELDERLKEILDGSESDHQKLRKIVGWVQREIAVGGERAGNLQKVWKQKEGTVPQITAVTRALLEHAGIPATLLLIHSAQEGRFDSAFLYPGAFSYPSLSAVVGDSTYYLFPYIRNYPVDQIPIFFQGETALRIGSDTARLFDTIPILAATAGGITSDFDATIDEEGVLTVTETRTLRGDDAFLMRRELAELDEEELADAMKEMPTYEEGVVTLTTHAIENLADYDKPLVIRLTYTVEDLVTITPDEAIVNAEGLFTPVMRRKYKVDTEERENPIKIYSDESLRQTIRLRVPAGWRLQSVPEDLHRTTSFGEVSSRYAFADGALTVDYTRTLRRAERPATEYADLLAIIGTRATMSLSTLVFSVE